MHGTVCSEAISGRACLGEASERGEAVGANPKRTGIDASATLKATPAGSEAVSRIPAPFVARRRAIPRMSAASSTRSAQPVCYIPNLAGSLPSTQDKAGEKSTPKPATQESGTNSSPSVEVDESTPSPSSTASIFCTSPLDQNLTSLIDQLEKLIGVQVWLLVQSRRIHPRDATPFDSLGHGLVQSFRRVKTELPNDRVALLIDSPGGDAKAAYQLAMMLKRQCGQFIAIVPRYAKSAATLFCLGAEKILMAHDAELGPLDVQIIEPDREEQVSALDEVQALDRLSVFAQETVDKQMQLLTNRSGMKIRTLLPDVHSFVSSLVRPLFEKIDIVHYTQMSRLLKVAEEYAIRLLSPHRHVLKDDPKSIARRLVHGYPEHGFFIDAAEAKTIGLNVEEPIGELAILMSKLVPHLENTAMIGRVEKLQCKS